MKMMPNTMSNTVVLKNFIQLCYGSSIKKQKGHMALGYYFKYVNGVNSE